MDQTATRIENKRDTKLKLHNNQQKYINGSSWFYETHLFVSTFI